MRPMNERAFVFDRYTLDLWRGCLREGEGIIALRLKSFEVLRYLVENPGRLVPKDEITGAVWPNVIVTDESLARCISDVRRALGDAAQRIIKTVHRRGYLLAVPVSELAEQPDSPRPALALPDKPSIAVLAFANTSGDPEQEVFADGIAEDIITALSKSRSLFVIARNSTFTYKGKTVTVNNIGRELGVRYVLEGSVRKAGNRVRVTAQLVEAATGGHLWADHLDRDLGEIFAVQDEISQNVSAAIQPALERSERERASRKLPKNLDAWECYHRGMWHYANVELVDLDKALGFFRRAIKLDLHFAQAYAVLAGGYLREAAYFRPETRAKNIPRALDCARRAVALDPIDATGHASLADALMMCGRHLEGMAEADLAVRLDPNSAHAHGAQSAARAWGGRPREAIESYRVLMRLSPFDPRMPAWLHGKARAHYWAEDYEAAITTAHQLRHLAPNYRQAYATLIAAFGQTEQIDEARGVMADALGRFGDSFHYFLFLPLDKILELRPEDRAHLTDGLRKAGVVS